MFWKKKNKETEKPGAFFTDDQETRDAFRVKPSLAEPIFVETEGKSLQAANISSGGISFANEGMQPGKIYKISFVLPHKEIEIQAELTLIRIDDNICYGQFFNIPIEMEDHIHDYVLYRQKEYLQSGC